MTFRNLAYDVSNSSINNFMLIDTRKILSGTNKKKDILYNDIPSNIDIKYYEDYNITYLDDIIRKKLSQEQYLYLDSLKVKHRNFENISQQRQTHIMREKTLDTLNKLSEEIRDIESGEKLRKYNERVYDIIREYKKYNNVVKVISFDITGNDDNCTELDEKAKCKVELIDKYLDIASEYLTLNITKINKVKNDVCNDCGTSLAKIEVCNEGTLRCPECYTEHDVLILHKLSKDSARINTNTNGTEDDSIDNFLHALTRYQGLQLDKPEDSLYDLLDNYFIKNGRSSGDKIKSLPLNNRGRRGDTNHKMLWNALSNINRSEYYEHVNLIGHVYWGWELPDVSYLRDSIIEKYNKTQNVFYQISPEERGRNSSLGTQYRLWRHLQLEGHECYMDEFKIAENSESLRIHNKLWKLMCEGTKDPNIYYMG